MYTGIYLDRSWDLGFVKKPGSMSKTEGTECKWWWKGTKNRIKNRIEKHLPIIYPRPGTAISRPGVSSASISLQTL